MFDFPQKIQIQTINRCNFACQMCPYPVLGAARARNQLDEQIFNRIIEETRLMERKVKLCLMLQNEPLLDPRFPAFVEQAHRAVDAISSISTVTNGSMLSFEMLDVLSKYDRFQLTISVNSTDASRYKKIHGRDLWDHIYDLLTTWKGPRGRIRVSFVLDDRSLEQAKSFHQYWGREGYSVRFVPQNSRAQASSNDSTVSFVDLDYGHCHYPVDTLTTLADGSVILCCNDWLHEETLGNLQQQSITEIWNSDRFRSLRDAAVRGKIRDASSSCKNCDYPMRSVYRMELESLIGMSVDNITGQLGNGIRVHRTSIKIINSESSLQAVVWHIDPENGVIVALVPDGAPLESSEILFEFKINITGLFSFGGLNSVWCPGIVRTSNFTPDIRGIKAYLIELDPQSPSFVFLQWYAADWKTPLPVATKVAVFHQGE